MNGGRPVRRIIAEPIPESRPAEEPSPAPVPVPKPEPVPA